MSTPRLKDSGERRTHTDDTTPKRSDEEPQYRYRPDSSSHETRDVHDDRSENRECERHVAIDQKQRPRNHLKPRDARRYFETNIAPRNCPATPLGGGIGMNEEIHSGEDQKDQTQKEPTDVS